MISRIENGESLPFEMGELFQVLFRVQRPPILGMNTFISRNHTVPSIREKSGLAT